MIESRKIAFKSLDQSVNPMTFNDFNSKKKRDELYWICNLGHSYKATVVKKISSSRACTICNSEKLFELLKCETHGLSKHKDGRCYKCLMSKVTVMKECLIHGETKHRGESCYRCRNRK